MSDAYSKELRTLALDVGSELGCTDFIRTGVYCMVSGPNFETIAEARMLLTLGCDSVGKTGTWDTETGERNGHKIEKGGRGPARDEDRQTERQIG